MLRKTLVLFIALLLAGSVSCAFAQFSDDSPSRFGIKLMNFSPMGGDVRGLKSLWLGPALDWHLNFDEDGRPLSYVTLGLMSTGDSGNKAGEIFATYSRIKRTPISDSRSRYTVIGAGIYNIEYRNTLYNPLRAVDDKTYLPGVHFGYGQEFNDTYFAEISISLLPNWQDTSWSGIYLNVGSRISM